MNAQIAFALIRITVGFFLFYHGWEVFDSKKMEEYAQWEPFKNLPMPYFLVLLGKGSEFLGGLCLMIGFRTREASILILLTMLFITFGIGNGRVWYEDQHPFLFALFSILYLTNGSGIWSIDSLKINTPR